MWPPPAPRTHSRDTQRQHHEHGERSGWGERGAARGVRRDRDPRTETRTRYCRTWVEPGGVGADPGKSLTGAQRQPDFAPLLKPVFFNRPGQGVGLHRRLLPAPEAEYSGLQRTRFFPDVAWLRLSKRYLPPRGPTWKSFCTRSPDADTSRSSGSDLPVPSCPEAAGRSVTHDAFLPQRRLVASFELVAAPPRPRTEPLSRTSRALDVHAS